MGQKVNPISTILLLFVVNLGTANIAIADAASGAASSPADLTAAKSEYWLLRPTPDYLMRPFSTNRPSVTEGPVTVDAGHGQVELSFVEYTYDYSHSQRSDDFSVLPVNFRIGLLSSLELDLFLNPYLHDWTRSRTSSVRSSGFGDTELRAAWNLWGNDGGDTALALLPFIRFPTAADHLGNHHIEGGLLVPVSWQLPADFQLGAMVELDADRNASNSGYGLDVLHSITISHEVFRKFTPFIEYVGISPAQTGHTYLVYFDAGVT